MKAYRKKDNAQTEDFHKRPRILMIGPGRKVKGGISSVINSYYAFGLGEKVELTFISSMEDGSKLKKIFVAITAYIRFCFLVKKCDIVHVHMAAQASFDRKSIFIKKAHHYRKKIIIHQHAGNFDDFFFLESNEKKRVKIKDIFALADKVIVLSQEWADFFRENVCDEKKITVLHNGVSVPECEKSDYSDQNVLYLGRLEKEKGVYDLLEAIHIIHGQVPNARFYFGGDGDMRRCKAIADKYQFKKNVRFLGWITGNEKEIYFRKCSVFVLPSYYEGMPMSLLEAMSHGLAVVVTNVGGIPQIIGLDTDGVWIEAGNVDSIADALTKLLKNPEMKMKLGISAKKRIKERFCIEDNIHKLYQIYRELEKD